MMTGTVIGSLWATKKVLGLGHKPLLRVATELGTSLVAADCVGAGEGETVLLATGGAARIAAGEDVPIDAAIVGIVDTN